jgi:diaminopropionate ammonia-lyase
MRMLGAPLTGDPRVISGESGAVPAGLAFTLLRGGCEDLRDALGLDSSSVLLMFSTEGNTDPERYLDAVWDGDYPSFGE